MRTGTRWTTFTQLPVAFSGGRSENTAPVPAEMLSTEPVKDLKRAAADARRLMEESKVLFGALDTKDVFGRLFKAARKFPLPPRQQPAAGSEQEKEHKDTKTRASNKEKIKAKA